MRKTAILGGLVAAGLVSVGAGVASADVVSVDADHSGSAVRQHIADHANVGPVDVLHDGVLNHADVDVHHGVLNDLGGVLNLDDVLR